MHYRDGTPVRFGDHVKGAGFNVKVGVRPGETPSVPVEITGVVVATRPNGGTCNLDVAHVAPYGGWSPGNPVWPTVQVESGDCANFDYIGPRFDDRFVKAGA